LQDLEEKDLLDLFREEDSADIVVKSVHAAARAV
jgi:hypothetical protein